jgi:WsaF, C-terminal domain
MKRLQRCKLTLVIVHKFGTKEQMGLNLKRISVSFPDIAELFSSYHLLQEGRTIDVDGDYGVISYSAETHFAASDAARQMNVTPVFFVQDYEPDFHGDGTLKTFTRSAFELPHVGVYNSRKLYEYFRDHSGIGQTSNRHYQHATFENPIKPMPWDWDDFRTRHTAKDKKCLIVYARPEMLGARNEFGIVILALKQALREGHLDAADWIFRGVGSMTRHLAIPLSKDAQMEMVPKLPLRDYEDMLLLGDIGISLISTPHPGIIHFQMASFGLATVTYATKGRSAEWLQAQSKNIVPSPVTIQGISDAVARAAELSGDLNARYHNAVRSVVHTDERDLDAAAEFVFRQKITAR